MIRRVGTLSVLLVGVARGQELGASEMAEIDVLNRLTHVVTALRDGRDAEAVRRGLVDQLRHDPEWIDAGKAVDEIMELCRNGAAIQAQISTLKGEARKRSDEADAKRDGALLRTAVGLYTGLGWGVVLKEAPTLLGGTPTSAEGVQIAQEEQQWRASLDEAALKLDRLKVKTITRVGVDESYLVTFSDSERLQQALRKLEAGADAESVRRELLIMARGRQRFPEVQFYLGRLYEGSNRRRARSYMRRALAQSGRIQKTNHLAAMAALWLGTFELGEALWSDDEMKREKGLQRAAQYGRQCIGHDRRFADGHLLATLAEAELDREYEELLDVCREILEAEPEHVWARVNVIDALSRMGRVDEAKRSLRRFLAEKPRSIQGLVQSDLVAASSDPAALAEVLLPRLRVGWDDAASIIPRLTNNGSVPIVDSIAVATFLQKDGTSIVIGKQHIDRLDPGKSIALEWSWHTAQGVQGMAVHVYGPHGVARSSFGRAPRSGRFAVASSTSYALWAGGRASGGSLQFPIDFQIVEDRTGPAMIAVGTGKLLRRCTIGIQFVDRAGETRQIAEKLLAWDPQVPVRIRLSPEILGALRRSSGCECVVICDDSVARGPLPIQPGYWQGELALSRVELSRDDFRGNDDGRREAPELFVVVYVDGTKVVDTRERFVQNSWSVEWSRPQPSFKVRLSQETNVEVQVWDKDVMDHDRLLRLGVSVRCVDSVGRSVVAQSRAGSRVVFVPVE